jgi:RHS repeat-associated protein
VLNEENSSGTLTRTYVGPLRHAREDGHPVSPVCWKKHGSRRLRPVSWSDWIPACGRTSLPCGNDGRADGSVRQVRSTANSLVPSYDYTPYGEEYVFTGGREPRRAGWGSTVPNNTTVSALGDGNDTASGVFTSRLYTGHEWDGTANMYFAPYRFYDPAATRWITADPLGMVDGPNLYGYVGGRPIVSTDPTGQSALTWTCGIVCGSLAIAVCGANPFCALAALAICTSYCDILGALQCRPGECCPSDAPDWEGDWSDLTEILDDL